MYSVQKQKIAIIGPGNMGKAIRDGLLISKKFNKENILFGEDKLKNNEIAKSADLIILAVEPSIIPVVLHEIGSALDKNKIIISLAARVDLNILAKYSNPNQPIVRVMPNICAKVGESMSCWTSRNLTVEKERTVKTLLRAIGKEILLEDESMFDAITSISGSGPAYVFLLAKMIEDFADSIQLDKKISQEIITQTFFGSAKMLKLSGLDADKLRKMVVSKGGTTEAALNEMQVNGWRDIFMNALNKARKRSSDNVT